MKKLLFFIFVLMLVSISACKQATNTSMEKKDDAMNIQLTGDECVAKGGEIVNTLSNPKYDRKLLLGEVVGMKCPCVCLKKETPKVETTGEAVVDAVGNDLNSMDNAEKDLGTEDLNEIDSGLQDIENI